MIIFAAEKEENHAARHKRRKIMFTKLIAERLGLNEKQVAGTLALLDDGATIPFIARYRKERTGALDEVQIAAISEQNDRLKEIQKRKETITKTIADYVKRKYRNQEQHACRYPYEPIIRKYVSVIYVIDYVTP